ncbi:MAG: hypothetical protein ABWY06_02420 [Pseudomonas sp.]|uniref:hypothetical protein n=1 Tax=Pseudomonas sp. TaxID=306 RepID=UPI003393BCED
MLERIVDFLGFIGLHVEAAEVPLDTVLPAIWVENGCLYYDPQRLRHPGDLLHEAGHLAVAPAAERTSLTGNIDRGPGEEMMAIAWSWAALTHLRLPPSSVFHAEGYRGGSQSIIDNFSAGRFFGVPMLQWTGMTLEPPQAIARGLAPFPHMLKWLRD